ncbi:MAG: hypothetical protein SGJ21_04355 [Alphaproteobacteria bacterium]|nr:hypothetical protein [Alphaproteobacteria bacterium]
MSNVRTLSAFNTATESENRIHDDAVAAKFGFTGGLVPGVDVFAYLAHMPAELWGEAWLAGGGMHARFVKPVYDGETVEITSRPRGEDELELSLSSRGGVCATGNARRHGETAPTAILPVAAMPAPDDRPAASPLSLPVGLALGARQDRYTALNGRDHLTAVREDSRLYDDGHIANAAWLLRRANYILADNVRLGPWIHVESDINLHGLVVDGDPIETRAVVLDNVETRGHLMVTLSFQILSGEGARRHSVATGRHLAIYEPRQVREQT